MQEEKYLQDDELKLLSGTVLNGLSGGFAITRDDARYSFQYISEAAAAIQGYTAKELMAASGGNAMDNCYMADRRHFFGSARKSLGEGESYSAKYRVRAKDGSIKWVLESGRKVRGENGEYLFYSLLQDVTELERGNTKTKNTLDMFTQMVSSLECGVLAYTIPDHSVIIMNKEAKRLFGIEYENVEEVLQHLTKDRVVEEDYGEIQSVIRRLKQSGDGVTYMFRTHTKDGEINKIEAHTKLMQFDDGTRFILSSLLDITERSRLTELLAHEKKQYREALTANCEYSFSFDVTDGSIRKEFVSRQGVNVIHALNLPVPVRFDFMIQEWFRIMNPRFLNENMAGVLKCEELISRFRRGETRVEVEYYDTLRDKYTRVSALLSENSKGHVLAFISAVDTTEERREEQETKQALTEAYEAANRANQAKSDFLSRMSHDIRTPMNAIIGMTAIAAAHLDDRERVEDCLAKVTSSGKHLLTLINEVLDMSKIESGKMELVEEEINLSELIDNLLVMVRPQIDAKGQELKVMVQSVEHEHVIGDSLHIQQAFVNIMGNAVKYTPEEGRISLTISEKVTNRPKVGCYEFVFEDNGIGMSQEYLKHIFEPFTRADETSHNKEQGTGLGLAITRNIIRMMGGDVKVESELGKGSKFTVTIYLKIQDVKQTDDGQSLNLQETGQSEENTQTDFGGRRVLLVEDNEINAEIAQEILESTGLFVDHVWDGSQAVNTLLEIEPGHYDLVFMDVQMPVMNGYEAARAIRATDRKDLKEIPIIAMTANAFAEDVQSAINAGMNQHIAKPLDFGQLMGTLKKWLKK